MTATTATVVDLPRQHRPGRQGHSPSRRSYNGPNEVADARENLDCLKRFRHRVVESGRLTDAQLDQVDSQVAAFIDEAVADAKAAPLPTPEDLLTDVYVKY
jgi:acetoin:2,6-dichlorophenolindophenol oxidoreductase subunit alpha